MRYTLRDMMRRSDVLEEQENKDSPALFITGITGRLGRQLFPALHTLSLPLIFLVRNRSSFTDLLHQYPHAIPSSYSLIEGDLTSFDASTCASRPLIVLHLAGSVSMGAPEKELFRINTEGTRALLSSFSHIRHFLFVSSIAVYGTQQGIVSEETPYRPDHPYGRSKAHAERLIRESGVPYTILQPAIIYGGTYEQPFFSLLRAMEKGNAVLIGSGENKIPFVHVDDVVGALLFFLRKGPQNSTFILTSGESLSQRDVYDAIARKTRWPSPRIALPVRLALFLAPFLRITPYEIRRLADDRQFSIEKIRHAGFTPRVSFAEGLTDVLARYAQWKQATVEKKSK